MGELTKTDLSVGVYVGIKNVAVLSTGEVFSKLLSAPQQQNN
ncbi:hypothetical protein [Niallia sp. NCCP-28]|nr:hypothetical protein [Niallia sp. NCCP-28]GKU83124.1 hypothetical protein NCCP28_25200 [Niallia sp. NCCP-28]